MYAITGLDDFLMVLAISSLATSLPPPLLISRTIALTLGSLFAAFNAFSIWLALVNILVEFDESYVTIPLIEITAIWSCCS